MALTRPELSSKVLQLMNRVEKRTGRKLYVSDGFRSDEYQAKLYADSISKTTGKQLYRVSPPGKSRHAKGGAADIHFVGVEDQSSPLYDVLGEEAEALGLVWGGHFKGVLPDRYHVELRETDAEAAERWEAFRKEALQSAGIAGAVVLGAVVLYLITRRRR